MKYEIGKIFQNGGSQAVRLPQAFRFEGDVVRIRREGLAVILEPLTLSPAEWFVDMDRFGEEPFMPDGRQQPDMPNQDLC